jgi:hypothetical protein
MTALDKNPTTTNFLSPINFDFSIQRSPDLSYYVQKIWLPGTRISSADQETPFVKIPYPGEHIDFETLDITFAVDETLTNWLDLYNWHKAMGTPDDLSEYASMASAPRYTGKGPTSEILVYILDSSRNPKFTFSFHDAWPVGVSGFQLDSTNPDVQYVKASASFEYSSYDVDAIV